MIKVHDLSKEYFQNATWFQLVVSCPDAKINLLKIDLADLLEDLSRRKLIKSWFFMNKFNKILFKIEKINNDDDASLAFNNLVGKIHGASVTVKPFEPEIFQFGGDVGWRLARSYFNSLSIDFIRLKLSQQQRCEIALLAIFDLNLRLCGDAWEAWDVMQRLLLIRNDSGLDFSLIKSELAGDLAKFSSALMTDPRVVYSSKLRKATYVANMVSANVNLVKNLKKKELSLLFSLRKIVPYYAIFIFNILDVSEADQKKIIRLLSFQLNPSKYQIS